MVWNIRIHKGIRGNQYIIPYFYFSNDGRVDANPHVVANDRCPLSLSSVFCSNRYTLVNVCILAKYRCRIDGNAIGMANVKSRTDLCIWRNLYVVDFTEYSVNNSVPEC